MHQSIANCFRFYVNLNVSTRKASDVAHAQKPRLVLAGCQEAEANNPLRKHLCEARPTPIVYNPDSAALSLQTPSFLSQTISTLISSSSLSLPIYNRKKKMKSQPFFKDECFHASLPTPSKYSLLLFATAMTSDLPPPASSPETDRAGASQYHAFVGAGKRHSPNTDPTCEERAWVRYRPHFIPSRRCAGTVNTITAVTLAMPVSLIFAQC